MKRFLSIFCFSLILCLLAAPVEAKIRGRNIDSNTITADNLAAGAVGSAALGDEVTVSTLTVSVSLDLPAASLDGADIKDNEITSTQLADGITVSTGTFTGALRPNQESSLPTSGYIAGDVLVYTGGGSFEIYIATEGVVGTTSWQKVGAQ